MCCWLTVGDERYHIGDECLSPYRHSSVSDVLSPLSDTSASLHERYIDVFSPQQQQQQQQHDASQSLVSLMTTAVVRTTAHVHLRMYTCVVHL